MVGVPRSDAMCLSSRAVAMDRSEHVRMLCKSKGRAGGGANGGRTKIATERT